MYDLQATQRKQRQGSRRWSDWIATPPLARPCIGDHDDFRAFRTSIAFDATFTSGLFLQLQYRLHETKEESIDRIASIARGWREFRIWLRVRRLETEGTARILEEVAHVDEEEKKWGLQGGEFESKTSIGREENEEMEMWMVWEKDMFGGAGCGSGLLVCSLVLDILRAFRPSLSAYDHPFHLFVKYTLTHSSGFIHILNFLCGYIPLFFSPFPSTLDFADPATASSEIASHLLDITRDVNPVPCHSHNDYWRRVPLYDALRWGCTGVEADVWLFDEDLFVGHSTYALTANKTFRSMYVDPLVEMLEYRNKNDGFSASSDAKQGVFQTEPSQTLVLLVDFKNDGRAIFPYVSSQLAVLREKGYLTYFDGTNTIEGPITVVATGNAPFDMIIANSTYRDIFFDAPLAQLYAPDPSVSSPQTHSFSSSSNKLVARAGQGTVGTSPTSRFDSTNSYYASVKMSKALGFVWWGGLSSSQLELLRGQVRGAHQRGLKARYWSAPKWPIGLRNRVWETLVREGVDYLNGDDLRGMVGLSWEVKAHWGSLVG